MVYTSVLNIDTQRTALYIIVVCGQLHYKLASVRICFVCHRSSTGQQYIQTKAVLWMDGGLDDYKCTNKVEAFVTGSKPVSLFSTCLKVHLYF